MKTILILILLSFGTHSEQSFGQETYDEVLNEYTAAMDKLMKQSPQIALAKDIYETSMYEHEIARGEHEQAWSLITELLPQLQLFWDGYQTAKFGPKPSPQLQQLRDNYETGSNILTQLLSRLPQLRERLHKTEHEYKKAENEYHRARNELVEQSPELKQLRDKLMESR